MAMRSDSLLRRGPDIDIDRASVFIVYNHWGIFVSQADRNCMQGRKCKARHGSNLRHGELPALRTASRGPRSHRDTHRFQSGRPARPDRLP